MKLRTLIVDDELHARENLRYLLEKYCPALHVCGTAENNEEAVRAVHQLRPEIVFLDICMPSGIEGFELLERLPAKDFQVIFVTAYKDYALKALQACEIAYLQKPVDIDDLKHAVARLLNNHTLFELEPDKKSRYNRALNDLSAFLTSPGE